MKKLSRRDFFNKLSQAGAGTAAGLTLTQIFKGAAAAGLVFEAARTLTGCASLQLEPEENVTFPPLKGQKVQPPEIGCFFGMHYERPGDHMDWADTYLKQKIGKRPKIVIPPYALMMESRIWGRFNRLKSAADLMSNEGTIPFINKMLYYYLLGQGLENVADDQVFVRDMTAYAKAITRKGRPFFFTTMHEMNINVWEWGLQPEAFKKVWRRMHDIFDQEGANEYATWVFEVYSSGSGMYSENPERYYPGDAYVDWLGISGYSRNLNSRSANSSLSGVLHHTYAAMRKHHPDKPVMIAEFGKTRDFSQSYWLKDAFKYIKNRPAIKGACYWDSVMEAIRDDHTLSEASFKVLDQVLKDPYFVSA